MGTLELVSDRVSDQPGGADQPVGQGVCRLIGAGEFGLDGHDEVRQMLTDAVTAGWRRVELDFTAATMIDAETVRMLADLRHFAARYGCELVILNLGARPRRTVQTIRGIDQLNGW
ncbi:MAG: STAS domain-containing protein [Actinobacteria bacterium]|nr:STAS domain-containing protein [Actinomycetota bacterium]